MKIFTIKVEIYLIIPKIFSIILKKIHTIPIILIIMYLNNNKIKYVFVNV